MSNVVSGRAIISPMKPSSAPHTERLSSRMAGLRPMAFPITFGVTIMSHINWTIRNTARAIMRIIQKFWMHVRLGERYMLFLLWVPGPVRNFMSA